MQRDAVRIQLVRQNSQRWHGKRAVVRTSDGRLQAWAPSVVWMAHDNPVNTPNMHARRSGLGHVASQI